MTGARHHTIEVAGLAAASVALVALMAIRFADMPIAIPAYAVLMVVLVVQTWIDLRTRRLPREITYAGIAIGAPLLTIAALVTDEPMRIWTMLAGAATALAALWLIHAASRSGMADGDVRFAPLLGMYLGWIGLALVPIGLFFAFVAGAVASAVLLATRRTDRRSTVAFGPFLAIGTVAAIMLGEPFLDLAVAR